MESFTQQLVGLDTNTAIIAFICIGALIFWATRKNDPSAQNSSKSHIHKNKPAKTAASSLDNALDTLFSAPSSEPLQLEYKGQTFSLSGATAQEVKTLILKNQKIPAIKILRKELNLDLLSAKEMVEMMAEMD